MIKKLLSIIEGLLFRQENKKNFIDLAVPTEDTAYYQKGILVNLLPHSALSLYDDRKRAYSARYIVLDGTKYDMDDSNSISNIVVPRFQDVEGRPNTAYDLAYNFQVRLKKEERKNIAIALACKTADMMIASPICWTKRDYYRVVIQLWTIGAIDEADNLLLELQKRVPTVAAKDNISFIRKQSFERNLRISRELNEDYLESSSTSSCCSKCASYRNRIYNISGKDRRFPKFSDYIKNPEEFCCLTFFGCFYVTGDKLTIDVYNSSGKAIERKVDAIKHSNRPFVDDRSLYEKQLDEKCQLKQEKRQKSDERYFNRDTWIAKYHKKMKSASKE